MKDLQNFIEDNSKNKESQELNKSTKTSPERSSSPYSNH